MADGFTLTSITFSNSGIVAHFDFGGELGMTAGLDELAPNIEEAIAVAAERTAADLRGWAQDAEDFAAATRAGGLRQALAGP